MSNLKISNTDNNVEAISYALCPTIAPNYISVSYGGVLKVIRCHIPRLSCAPNKIRCSGVIT